MYLPKHFEAPDREHALAIMREHPFAILVSTAATGEPFATHAPLAIDVRGENIVLVGHFARANPHSALLAERPDVLAIFNGPHAYVSPTRYTTRKAVPTWNYIAVHAYGTARVHEPLPAKDTAQKRLIDDHEPEYAEHWRGLDAAYQESMLGGITVFEITVTRLEAKFKLSQNRPAADRANVGTNQAAGTENEQALAGWMRRLGLVTPP
jgi:transcriptional regulator